MKPLIGITAGEIINKLHPWSPVVYGQSHTYVDAIIHAGGIPIIVPITGDKDTLRELYDRCDGLLMSGGNDIDPSLYAEAQTKKTVDISTKRDSQELLLIEWALKDDKPLLGICRGMQLLNVSQGGSLYQDLDTQLPAALNHHSSTDKKTINDIAHDLKIDKESKLAAALGATNIQTNTHHHQAVKRLAPSLIATSKTEDDVIESLEMPKKAFVLGVQSHPESLEASTETQWAPLFSSFVSYASQYAQNQNS